MIQGTKKRTIFLFGVLITTVVAFVGDYIRVNNFKKTSSLVCTAYADIMPTCSACGCAWTSVQCDNFQNGSGDACCGDASSDSGGGAGNVCSNVFVSETYVLICSWSTLLFKYACIILTSSALNVVYFFIKS